MQTAVIVSTYNSPDWLEKVLWGLKFQSLRDFKVVVADDGSTEETAERIGNLRSDLNLDIQHVWHQDAGFRKCAILNKAVAATEAEYIVFLDGDCVPREDFIASHLTNARPKRFLSGGAVRLPMQASQAIGIDDVREQRAFRPSWLRSQGFSPRRQSFKLTGRGWWGHFLDRVSTTAPTFNGGNASLFKQDFVNVNGFDERMQHGGLDRELGERLERSGVRGMQIRHRAICVHLDHSRGYADAKKLSDNHRLRAQNRVEQTTWTEFGMERVRGAA